jgi:starch synthase
MSVQEGWGMVLAEAMACGLPVICSANTAAEDIVSEGVEGYIVPIRDVEALKSRIKWCYEHREERAAMGQAARQRVSQGFSWDNYGEKIHEAYSRALRARGRIRGEG